MEFRFILINKSKKIKKQTNLHLNQSQFNELFDKYFFFYY